MQQEQGAREKKTATRLLMGTGALCAFFGLIIIGVLVSFNPGPLRLTPDNGLFYRVVIVLLLFLSAVLVMAVLGAALLLTRMNRSTSALLAGVERLNRGEPEAFPGALPGGESRIVANALNTLSGRLRENAQRMEQVEEALHLAREKAEAAASSKRKFLENMSHEIRTPMNGIIGMTELLRTTGMDPLQMDYASAISESANALLGVLSDILDFSMLEEGGLLLSPEPFNLRAMMEEIGGSMMVPAREKGLEVLVRYPPGAQERFTGDPARIRQVVTNLAHNAVKFTDTGHILLEMLPGNPSDERGRFRIVVSDTGIGIPRSRQKIIFDTFCQADESTTRRFGGTGLGLALCRKLATLMGGTLVMDPVTDRGAIFVFSLTLPVDHAPPDTPLPLPDPPPRVLVVDDNPAGRRIVLDYLGSGNIPCEASDSAAHALRMLRRAVEAKNPFGIAVIDDLMPEMDGILLASEIKADDDLKDTIPILLSSNSPAGENGISQPPEGFAAVLAKPVGVKALLSAVSAAWEKKIGDRVTPVPSPGPGPGRAPVPGDPRFDARILLVEDNPMNQRVAAGILKRFGCLVDVVENGEEALLRSKRDGYDMIFMDIHMPVMDGFDAAGAIRKRERGETRIPIIAITALAMEGDRERCLSAGMDDYIPKPFQSSAVREVLNRFLMPASAPSREAPSEENTPRRLNPGILMDITGADPDIIGELVAEFLNNAPEYLNELFHAVSGGDKERIFNASHRLKGMVANAGGERARAQLDEIETKARKGPFIPDILDLSPLARELVHLQDALLATDWHLLCEKNHTALPLRRTP